MKPYLRPSLFICGFSLLLAVALAGDAPPAPTSTAIQRFQVIPSCNVPGFEPYAVSIRLDTATGKTWQLMQIGVSGMPGAHVLGWVAIEEDPVGRAKEVEAAAKLVK